MSKISVVPVAQSCRMRTKQVGGHFVTMRIDMSTSVKKLGSERKIVYSKKVTKMTVQ